MLIVGVTRCLTGVDFTAVTGVKLLVFGFCLLLICGGGYLVFGHDTSLSSHVAFS